MWTVGDWEKMVRVLGEINRERSEKRGKHNEITSVTSRRSAGKGLKKYAGQVRTRKVSIGAAARKSV